MTSESISTVIVIYHARSAVWWKCIYDKDILIIGLFSTAAADKSGAIDKRGKPRHTYIWVHLPLLRPTFAYNLYPNPWQLIWWFSYWNYLRDNTTDMDLPIDFSIGRQSQFVSKKVLQMIYEYPSSLRKKYSYLVSQ